jgi:hypothetical protein
MRYLFPALSLLALAGTHAVPAALAQETRRATSNPTAGRGDWAMNVVSDELSYPWDIIGSAI